MNLSNVPSRALRKGKKNGVRALFRAGRDLLITDLLLYRLVYSKLLQNQIDVISRENLHHFPGYRQYEINDDTLRTKGKSGFRGEANPERYLPGDRFVCEISETALLGPDGIGLTANGSVIAETAGSTPISTRRIGIGLSQSITVNGIREVWNAFNDNFEPQSRFDTVALVVPSWNNYYHWTIECLIRIRLLEKYGADTGEYPTLLVPADRPTWMDESLAIIGYKGEINSWDGGIAKVNTLVVPTFPDPIPIECFWLRDRMRSKELTVDDGSERVFVARDDATVRRVSNRDTVERVLSKFNIKKYILSEMSVREQIDLFSHAELVVGPHGAGLTNIVFGEDLTLIELFGDKMMATFDRLAENMGHEYRYLHCQQVGTDIQVQPDQLEQAIENSIKN